MAIEHTCDGVDKSNCQCARQHRAARRRRGRELRGEPLSTAVPLVHTCDGTDIRKCACVRARRAELRREHRRGNYREARRDNLRRFYGIGLDEYEAMRKAQRYRCACCGRHEDELKPHAGGRPRLDGSPAATPVKLVVDHCHLGGGNRALLCQGCNVGLGAFADDPDRLIRAARYLRRHRR